MKWRHVLCVLLNRDSYIHLAFYFSLFISLQMLPFRKIISSEHSCSVGNSKRGFNRNSSEKKKVSKKMCPFILEQMISSDMIRIWWYERSQKTDKKKTSFNRSFSIQICILKLMSFFPFFFLQALCRLHDSFTD